METAFYLAQIYWPYALAALMIGIGAGWFSRGARK